MTENKTILNKEGGLRKRKKGKSLIFWGLSFVYSGLMQTADNFDDSLEGKGE